MILIYILRIHFKVYSTRLFIFCPELKDKLIPSRQLVF